MRAPCLVLLLLLAMVTTGCQTARFYSQAVAGQWEIVSKRRPMDQILADPDAPATLKRQLQRVRELCAFAQRELDLPAAGQFTRYADLERPFVVWNIHAAPIDSLKSKSWWYPFVGRLEYQGYFKREQAADYAQRLRARGLDVFTGGVVAYSTLGWFNDPVLNTFVGLPESELADLIFHELAHQRVFVPGDTDFNKAFATTVAREGVRRWFHHRGDAAATDHYLRNRAAEDAVVALILAARDRLEALYATPGSRTANELPAGKAGIISDLRANYATLKQRWPDYRDYDDWMAAPINNAQINTVDTYYDLVPGFTARLAQLDGDLPAFYADMKAMRKISKIERRDRLATVARAVAPQVRPDEEALAQTDSAATRGPTAEVSERESTIN